MTAEGTVDERLKEAATWISDQELDELLREARLEALAEARGLLRGAIVEAILEAALCRLRNQRGEPAFHGSSGPLVTEGPPPAAPPGPVAAPGPSQADGLESEELQREIEAIRQQIAENERLLQRAEGPASLPGGVPPGADPSPVALQTNPEHDAPQEHEALREHEALGYYVYGIIGMDGDDTSDGLPEQGVDPAHAVHVLTHRELQAVVSRVSLREFDQEQLEARLSDTRWLEAAVRAHQAVLETALHHHTVIPIKFGTIYQSEAHLRAMLDQCYGELMDHLGRLEDASEWGLKIYRDDGALARVVATRSERVRELQVEIAAQSSGAAYFCRKKLDALIAEEVEQLADQYAQASHDRLAKHAGEVVLNALQGRDVTGRAEQMALNGAYLVTAQRWDPFRAELDRLVEEYGDRGLIYELTGPWPPYNFVTIGTGGE